jgi:hypothetical protein
MNKKSDKKSKLGLDRQLVRTLDAGELRVIAGGNTVSNNTCGRESICYEF